ncbi:hypothetical protein ACQUD3_13575, partial [Lactococcus lactis]|uniref:hypothetical protein n=1 Tax=Lactococcus lactis TaxID=1358 RepID=UPI002890B114
MPDYLESNESHLKSFEEKVPIILDQFLLKRNYFFQKFEVYFSLTLSFYFLKCEIKDLSIQRYHER